MLVLHGVLASLAYFERQSAIDNAENVAELAANQGADNADAVLDTVDRTLGGIAEAISLDPSIMDPNDLYLHRLLVRQHGATPFLRGLFIISPEGEVIHTSIAAHIKPVDVSDRDYVAYYMAGGGERFFIGRPITSRVTGTWVVPVSRRIDDRFGRMVAIIAAGFDPEAFVRTLRPILPHDMTAAVMAANGDLLGCLPKESCLGQSGTNWPLFTMSVRPGEMTATPNGAYIPGSEGPAAIKSSRIYGVTVATQASLNSILRVWHERLWLFAGLGIAGTAFLIAGALALGHQVERRKQALLDLAAANATLEARVIERTADLQRSEERLKAFIATAQDAIVIVDGQGTLVSFNHAAESLFGYAANEVIGENVTMLMPSRFHHDHLRALGLATAKQMPVAANREFVALHYDGTEVPIELTLGTTESNGEMIHVGILRDIRARKAQEEALWELATSDGLTKLLNRRAFMEQAAPILDGARRYGRPLAALMVDADHFKAVNDTYGHHIGDMVLCVLAEILRSVTRKSDLVGRLGGEEFALLLPETDEKGALTLADRALATMRSTSVASTDATIGFTASIGLAMFDGHESLEALLRDADQALYRAKQSGRDRVMIHRPDVPA